MSREKMGKPEQIIDGGGCSKPLCQASTLIELTFMEAMEKVMDAKFAKLEDRLGDMEDKNEKMFRIICSDDYGKGMHMQNGGKMEQRFSNLRDTLDSVSESVIDKLIPAVIKMQKDVKTIRKDIDTMTNLQDDENMRLNQSIQKMQERLDETYLRASDTKQMGRAIIKNTEDLLRGSNKDQRDFEVENTTDEMNYNEGMEKQEMKEEDHGKATFNDGKTPRSPADDNTLRERSTSHERPRADNYDPEAILIGSIQKEKSMEHSGKQNTSDPRRRPSADRYRHRSSFSDRHVPNGERFSSEHDRKNSVENNIKSPGNRRDASPVRSMPERNKRPRTPPEDPRARPPSPDGNRRQPSSPDHNMGRNSMSPPRRLSSSERQGRAPRRERSPMVMRYPTPPDDRRPRAQRARTPLSPGKVYTDKQESTEENGVFIDKFGEQKHWTRWTYSEPDIKRSRLDGTPPIEDDNLAADRRVTVTIRRTPPGSPKRVREGSSSSEEGVIH